MPALARPRFAAFGLSILVVLVAAASVPSAVATPPATGAQADCGVEGIAPPSGMRLQWAKTCLVQGTGAGVEALAGRFTNGSDAPSSVRVSYWDNENGYASPGYGFDYATGIAASPNGDGVFVTGVSWTGPGDMSQDWVTLGFDRGGRSRWMTRLNGGFERFDAPAGIVVTPDGSRVIVTGTTDFRITSDYASDIRTVAYDSRTGRQIWSASYDGPMEGDYLDTARAIAMSPDGTEVYVAGQTQVTEANSGGSYESAKAVVAYRVIDGVETWSAVSEEGGTLERPADIVADPLGRFVYVTGGRAGGVITTTAYRTGNGGGVAGSVAWNVAESDIRNQEFIDGSGLDLDVSPSGDSVYLLGSQPEAPTAGFRLIAYDAATGNRSFTSTYRPSGPYVFAYPKAVAVARDGRSVFVTGYSGTDPVPGLGSDSDIDYTTIAYDAHGGQQRWISQFDRNATDLTTDVAVTADGKVVVTGLSLDGVYSRSYWGFDLQPAFLRALFGSEAATVAYDPSTGTELWRSAISGFSDGASTSDGYGGLSVAPGADGGQLYVLGAHAPSNAAGAVGEWSKWLTKPPIDGNTMNYGLYVYELAG